MEIRGTASYFSSTANYSDDGSSTDLANGGDFTSVMGDFIFSYDWKPDWRFYGGATAGYVETSDGNFTRSNSGLNEIVAGAQNWYDVGSFDLGVQGDFVYPFFKIDENSDEAFMGEGAMRIRTGAWAIYPMGPLKPFGYLGFEYRDGGRSFLLPYSVGMKYTLGKIWVQGEFRGYESVVDDADTDNRADRDVILSNVNGGSYRFYSINPAVSEIAAEVGIRLGSITLLGGVAMTVIGSSSADGWTAMAGFAYSPSIGPREKVIEDDFKIRSERYDESVFQPEEPVLREEPAPTAPAPLAPQNTPPPPPTKPRKSPKQQAMDDAQDVEMQIELQQIPAKKKKKKKKSKNVDKLLNDVEKSLEN